MDERGTPLRTLAQANRAHLRERSHRLRLALADKLHSGHERGADGAHARQQNSELPLGGRDFGRLFHATPFYWTIARRSTEKMNLGQEVPQRKRAASPNKQIIMRDAAKICKSRPQKIISPPCCRHSGQFHLDLSLAGAAIRVKVREIHRRAFALKESWNEAFESSYILRLRRSCPRGWRGCLQHGIACSGRRLADIARGLRLQESAQQCHRHSQRPRR